MLANIKNGQIAKKTAVIHPHNPLCASLLDILWNEGFISGYRFLDKPRNKFKIFLKYEKEQPAINVIKPLTVPGLRNYYSLNQLWKIKLNNSLLILSTTKGLFSLEDCKKLKLGGSPFLIVR